MLEIGAIVANHQFYQDNISGFNEGVQAYSDDGGLVAQHLDGTGVIIYNESLELLIKLSSVSARWTSDAVSGLAFDSDGDNLYILDNVSHTIVQVSTSSWTIVQEIPIGLSFESEGSFHEGDYGNRLLVGPNARYFTVVTDSGLQLVVNPFVSATISGTNASETITGTGLDDVLEGLDGDDEMIGGDGNDVYMVADEGDSVVELSGEGTDEVRTALGSKSAPDYALYVLPDFVENLTGTSTAAQGVRGNTLDNVVTMGVGNDLIVLDDGGADTVDAGSGNDYIYYGAALTGADVTNGGAGTDTLGLLGNYSAGGLGAIAFTASNLIGVERLALYTGGGTNNYSVTMNDANVAAGTEFFVTAASLNSAETLFFNGSAETNGRFTLLGGSGADLLVGGRNGDYVAGNAGDDVLYGIAGDDFLLGGLGADELNGGGGYDSFRYSSTAESTAGSVDQIIDFTDLDRIDLSRIDANGNSVDGDTAFTFIGTAAFTNVAGQLRATESGGVWTVEGDVNGDGLADLIIEVNLVSPMILGASDFNL